MSFYSRSSRFTPWLLLYIWNRFLRFRIIKLYLILIIIKRILYYVQTVNFTRLLIECRCLHTIWFYIVCLLSSCCWHCRTLCSLYKYFIAFKCRWLYHAVSKSWIFSIAAYHYLFFYCILLSILILFWFLLLV